MCVDDIIRKKTNSQVNRNENDKDTNTALARIIEGFRHELLGGISSFI